MDKLTKEQKDLWIRNHRRRCPVCGCKKVIRPVHEFKTTKRSVAKGLKEVYLERTCTKCKNSWYDVYEFTKVSNINDVRIINA